MRMNNSCTVKSFILIHTSPAVVASINNPSSAMSKHEASMSGLDQKAEPETWGLRNSPKGMTRRMLKHII